eukprot:COSAG02_NODE_5075_length_4661_cov_4.005261_4_plen_215_part_00
MRRRRTSCISSPLLLRSSMLSSLPPLHLFVRTYVVTVSSESLRLSRRSRSGSGSGPAESIARGGVREGQETGEPSPHSKMVPGQRHHRSRSLSRTRSTSISPPDRRRGRSQSPPRAPSPPAHRPCRELIRAISRFCNFTVHSVRVSMRSTENSHNNLKKGTSGTFFGGLLSPLRPPIQGRCGRRSMSRVYSCTHCSEPAVRKSEGARDYHVGMP